MSLRGGSSPSTLAAPVTGNDSRLAAKHRAAAKEHRSVTAEMAAPREGGGADRALHLVNKRTKVAASALQRPPISSATTVSRQAGPGQFRACRLLDTSQARRQLFHRQPCCGARSRQAGNERGVDCDPKWPAVGNDLNAPVVLPLLGAAGLNALDFGAHASEGMIDSPFPALCQSERAKGMQEICCFDC